MFHEFLCAVTCLALMGLGACSGSIGGGADQPGGGPGAGGVNGGGGGRDGTGAGNSSGAPCVKSASFAPARVTLISDEQYRNIVHDVFGVTFPATLTVTTLSGSSGAYPYNENAAVETTTVQAYQRAADQVAALMTTLPPCPAGAIDDACLGQFLRTTVSRAWRRPLTDAEVNGLLAIYDSAAMDGPARQLQLTIEASLMHPAFLYRTEVGANSAAATGKVALTPFELAGALSFALLNSTPDAELWAKAQDGSLTQAAVLQAQVGRLLTSPAVKANLMKKVSYFLSFETLPAVKKDPATYPAFAALQGTLYQSAQAFLKDIIWDGHFSDLFTSRRIYADRAVAAAYGLPAVSGTGLQGLTAPAGQYDGGILTQPALLAATNKNAAGDDVIHRGLWVYYNLLCAPVLPPPPQNATAVAATQTGSTREQAMTRDSSCGAGCHGRFDPFGLVTLNYDNIGRFRTTDPTSTPPGAPVDTGASIAAGVLMPDPGPVTLTGVADVARRFATSPQVSDCATATLATYTLDHSPEQENSCELTTIKSRFGQSGSFADLFTAIVTSPAFLSRDL